MNIQILDQWNRRLIISQEICCSLILFKVLKESYVLKQLD